MQPLWIYPTPCHHFHHLEMFSGQHCREPPGLPTLATSPDHAATALLLSIPSSLSCFSHCHHHRWALLGSYKRKKKKRVIWLKAEQAAEVSRVRSAAGSWRGESGVGCTINSIERGRKLIFLDYFPMH